MKTLTDNSFGNSKLIRGFSGKSMLIWLFAFSLVGIVTLLLTHAATPSLAIEPESGTTSGVAVVGSDPNASNGGYVKFGTTGSGGATVLDDEFNGTTIDTTKWDVYDRIGDQANSEVNCVIPANVSISGGMLNGLSKHEDHTCGDTLQAPVLEHYTSWQIGQKTAPFTYGTIQIRAKEPAGTGIWPTMFLLGNKWQASQPGSANNPAANGSDQGWGEIDFAEFLQNNRNQVNVVSHVNGFGGTFLAPLPFDATSRFMVYRLDWTPTALTYSVDAEDGVGFRTLRTITDPTKIPSVPYYLTINAAIGGIGGGTPDPNTFPQTFQIDWVRITQ